MASEVLPAQVKVGDIVQSPTTDWMWLRVTAPPFLIQSTWAEPDLIVYEVAGTLVHPPAHEGDYAAFRYLSTRHVNRQDAPVD